MHFITPRKNVLDFCKESLRTFYKLLLPVVTTVRRNFYVEVKKLEYIQRGSMRIGPVAEGRY